ncbi:diguanylate cyclase [Ideonella sp.]|uniref:GGDEF domain-containing protein n=1 Tax=Ideonella sp. TaxID=1929293 RepID=UPI003BB70A83
MSAYLLVALQMLLYAGLWLLASLALRHERSAMLHWLGYALTSALGMALIAWRPAGPPWLTGPMVALCIVGSLMLASRGVERFLAIRPRDLEYAGLLGACLLLLLWTGPAPEQAHWRQALASSVAAWLLGRGAVQCWGALLREYGQRVALAAAAPVLAMLLLNAALAVRAVLTDPAIHNDADEHSAQVLTWTITLVAAAAFNFLFVFLVVLRLLLRMSHQARHDPLTGLLNRRAMSLVLEAEWQRQKRLGMPFSVLSLDLDHFKQINDQHGHEAGDRVLQALTQRIQPELRAVDRFARMGGEEFLILMPGCAADQDGLSTAERLRARLTADPLEAGRAGSLPISASWGVAGPQPEDAELEAVLRRVDAALYLAKHTGRNRVVLGSGAEAVTALSGDLSQGQASTRPLA